MAIREINVKTVKLTLDLAKHFDRMRTLKGDRDPDSLRGKKRVAELHQLLCDGLFHSPTWSTVIIKEEGGKKYREDGGSSSRMLVQCGANFPVDCMVTIREFESDTIAEGVILYEQFNRHFSTRSQTDLIKNRIAYIPQLSGKNPAAVARALSGLRYYMKVNKMEIPRGEEILNQLYPRRQPIAWLTQYMENKYLHHSGVMAAMVATWTISNAKAASFWNEVYEGNGKSDMPSRMLLEFLIKAYGERGHKKHLPLQYYSYSIHAWNAFRKEKKIAILKWHGNTVPVPI